MNFFLWPRTPIPPLLQRRHPPVPPHKRCLCPVASPPTPAPAMLQHIAVWEGAQMWEMYRGAGGLGITKCHTSGEGWGAVLGPAAQGAPPAPKPGKWFAAGAQRQRAGPHKRSHVHYPSCGRASHHSHHHRCSPHHSVPCHRRNAPSIWAPSTTGPWGTPKAYTGPLPSRHRTRARSPPPYRNRYTSTRGPGASPFGGLTNVRCGVGGK